MKIAPLAAALRRRPAAFESVLVHTGQHYDEKLSQVFFDELGIPRPDINLNVGSGSHAQQTAAIMAAFEPVLIEQRIDLVLVVGDVNSTIACALVATKLGVPVAHVEAGLRSFDRRMPEEINRVLTDQISDLLFTTEESALDNLRREGVDPSRVHFVGNVMIDTLLAHRERARSTAAHHDIGVTPGEYALMTLHRPSNVDDTAAFERLMQGLEIVGRDVPVVFPVHPRTRPTVTRSATAAAMVAGGQLRLVEPLGYLDFIGLMERLARRADRFRRHPGGDDHPRRSLPDAAREHRAPDHDHPRHEPAGGHGPGGDCRGLAAGQGRARGNGGASALGRPCRRADRRRAGGILDQGPGRREPDVSGSRSRDYQNVTDAVFEQVVVPTAQTL